MTAVSFNVASERSSRKNSYPVIPGINKSGEHQIRTLRSGYLESFDRARRLQNLRRRTGCRQDPPEQANEIGIVVHQ